MRSGGRQPQPLDQRAVDVPEPLLHRLFEHERHADTAAVLRRQDVPRLIDAASANAHVVVFDAGPLLETAATIHLAHLVDAVVLALPVRRLSVRALSTVAAQLRGRRGYLFPVLVPATRPTRRAGSGTAPIVVPESFDEPVVV
jgi:hypothetical protein